MNLNRFEAPTPRENYVEMAHVKAKEIIEKGAIDPKNFSDLYHSDVVGRDLSALAGAERKFAQGGKHDQTGHKLADIFEALIYYHGEQSNWFGPSAETIKTSRYDDVFNGVDIVAEFTEPSKVVSRLALAIDATFNDAELDAGIKKMLAKIEAGEMLKVKYFQSSDGTFRGELNFVPGVIICASEKTIRDLAALWLDDPNLLAEHPVQFQNLEEIIEQLEFFASFADKVKQPKIADKYRQALSIAKEIYQEKKENQRDLEYRDEASVIFSARISFLREQIFREG